MRYRQNSIYRRRRPILRIFRGKVVSLGSHTKEFSMLISECFTFSFYNCNNNMIKGPRVF